MRSAFLLPACAMAIACNGRTPPVEVIATAPSPSATADRTASSAAAAAPPALPPSVAPQASAKADAGKAFERRCGWVDNPTPSNWWITDADGEWEIGIQGGYQAEGDMPDFGARWVETNVHYGYGCACMDVRLDRAEKKVIEYRKVKVLPIEQCKKDRKLPPR